MRRVFNLTELVMEILEFYFYFSVHIVSLTAAIGFVLNIIIGEVLA